MGMAQEHLGFRLTPNLTAVPKVFNDSPAAISTGTTTALEAGIDYTRMFNGKWGLNLGTDFGTSNWSYNVKAPLSAFGDTATDEASFSKFHNYLYNSAAINAVYKINSIDGDIRLFAGPTFRFQHSQRAGNSRNGPNKNDMYSDVGSANSELLIEYPEDRFRLTTMVSAGVGYEHTVSENVAVLLGLRANVGLQNVTRGIISINMNNQLYRGTINTNSGYLGLDVAFRFKTGSNISKRKSK